MNFLKKVFSKKEESIKNNKDFWKWFQLNEKRFFDVINKGKNIEEDFVNRLGPKLTELKEGYFFLAGMYDDHTAELILTADGAAKNIVFIEDLANEAPKLKGWRFTALKPALDIENVAIDMYGYRSDSDNLFFYANEDHRYPDEIDITIVHKELNNENVYEISNGVYLFLDNYLGELHFLNHIDNLRILGTNEAQGDLVPIAKLKDFLIWREKEFVEKYDAVRYATEEDEHTILEAELENGNKLLAVINKEILNWTEKVSHPWLAVMTLKYDGSSHNGMPGQQDYELLHSIEERIMNELRDSEGYLNIGRQTSEGERKIYFACKEFRNLSKVLHKAQLAYNNHFEISYDISKDKYWRSLERFKQG